ncbi:MAG: hypothetical protein LAT56_17770, partial [Wenzhouxiangella sp.]|nr:hypothetical protein [Wenzhouxiangella sp.]
MIRAYTTDEQRPIQVTPEQDVDGRIIWANVYFGDKYVKTVNNVVPSLTRSFVVFSAINILPTQQEIELGVYGRMLNNNDWELIDTYAIPIDPSEDPVSYQREYDR